MTGDDILPFELRNSVRLIQGLGYSGTHARIIVWEVVNSPLIGSLCPNCGYDRVKHYKYVKPESSDKHEYECAGCGASKERLEQREKKRRQREEEMRRAVEEDKESARCRR